MDVLIDKMIRLDRKITDTDVQRRWEAIYGPGGRSFDARMILVGAPALQTPKPDATAEDLARAAADAAASMTRLAEDLVRRIRNGEDFGTLAERYSKDAQTAKRGGSMLGGRFNADQWNEGVAKTVTALTPGEVSDPIQLVQGMAIFERGPDRYVPLEDVREDILRQLREQRASDVECSYYRNALYKQSRVEILPAMNE
jgi:parvulin-like peptidyl-prolyl isomerase